MQEVISNTHLARSLEKAHEKLDALTPVIEKLNFLLEYRKDHEDRLRSLERFRWISHGLWLVIGGCLAWIGKHF